MCGRNLGKVIYPALAGVLASGAFSTSSDPTAVPAFHSTCPVCHAPLSPGYLWCPHCGLSLQAKPAARVQPQSCAYCGRTLPANAEVCASCGAPAGKR